LKVQIQELSIGCSCLESCIQANLSRYECGNIKRKTDRMSNPNEDDGQPSIYTIYAAMARVGTYYEYFVGFDWLTQSNQGKVWRLTVCNDLNFQVAIRHSFMVR
jgi:hypothetical protein